MTPSLEVKVAHTDEVNWLPLSEVTSCGTPEPGDPAVYQGGRTALGGGQLKRDCLGPVGRAVHHHQEVRVTAGRLGKRNYQVDMKVAEPLGRVSDGLWRRHRLCCHLGQLALLAIATRGRDL